MGNQRKYFLDEELALRLEAVAREVESTPQAVLNGLVEGFILRHDAFFVDSNERRSFKRLEIDLPAVIHVDEEDGAFLYQAVSIRDITPVGVRLVCNIEKAANRFKHAEQDCSLPFELIFSLSDDVTPIRFSCLAKRIEIIGQDVHIGSVIADSNYDGIKLYKQILGNGLKQNIDSNGQDKSLEVLTS